MNTSDKTKKFNENIEDINTKSTSITLYEAVCNVATRILSEGNDFSVPTIQKEIGCGSRTIVTYYLQKWCSIYGHDFEALLDGRHFCNSNNHVIKDKNIELSALSEKINCLDKEYQRLQSELLGSAVFIKQLFNKINNLPIVRKEVLMSKPKKVFRSKEEWQRIVSEFNDGNEKAEAFCQNRGLAYSTFKKWQQRLKDLEKKQLAFCEHSAPENDIDNQNNQWHIEIQLGDGRILRLNSNVDVYWVAQLLALSAH